jgi:hypothetical protein
MCWNFPDQEFWLTNSNSNSAVRVKLQNVGSRTSRNCGFCFWWSCFIFVFQHLWKSVCACACVCVCVCVCEKLFPQVPGIVNSGKRHLEFLWNTQAEMLRKFQIQFKAHICDYMGHYNIAIHQILKIQKYYSEKVKSIISRKQYSLHSLIAKCYWSKNI